MTPAQTDLLSNLALGLSTALTPENLFYCFLGVLFGTFTGVIPGIGTLAAVSLLFPITFHLDPTPALIMLAGIYYGTTYGGSTASILLNIPGTPSNAVVCLDGYPMARQGRAGVALFMTTVASFVGGSIGILLMIFLSPVIVRFALMFAPADYFSLILLGLVGASTVARESVLKSLIMIVVGILIGLIGLDIYYGSPRYTFGVHQLYDGIGMVALAIGLFGVAEIIASIGKVSTDFFRTERIRMRNMLPTNDEWRRSIGPMLRGAGIGSFFGTLPGTGGTIAAFVSYSTEKELSRHPEQFGKGAIEGIMGPETSNNAADQTAFIPTMTLGIPGTATMALMLGVLMIHGITPGPRVVTDQPQLFWGLIMSFWVGNIMLVALNIPLIGIWVRMLTIPYRLLYPCVMVFVGIGVYTINNNVFDIFVVLVFGLLGYGMRLLDFPPAPLLLGFVLGPMLEEHFRRAMLLSQGNFSVFIERPISATVLALSAGLLLWSLYSAARAAARRRALSPKP